MAISLNPFTPPQDMASNEMNKYIPNYVPNHFPYTPVLDFMTCGYLAPTDETAQKGKPKETTAEQDETRPLTELTPKRILKSGNRTIVFWQDGTKTIVKRADDEAESGYAAFTAALAIKLYGSNSAVKRIVDKTETQKPKKQKAQKAE